jgi:pimeloyl-ACP methyl ester carboxylesterase
MKALARITGILFTLFAVACSVSVGTGFPGQRSINLSDVALVAGDVWHPTNDIIGSRQISGSASQDVFDLAQTSLSAAATASPSTLITVAPITPSDSIQELQALRRDRLVKPELSNNQPPAVVNSVPRQPFATQDLFIFIPPTVNKQKPVRVLVALHGMGNRGDVFSNAMLSTAEANGWILIAPTMQYRDWTNPDLLLQDDLLYTRMLHDTLDTLSARLGIPLRKRALVLGFSRGAQLAQRFAFFYPEQVGSVAMISGGAYTLAVEKRDNSNNTGVLALPYGLGDAQKHIGKPINWAEVKKVSFWVAVGASDNHKDDVPRMFDPFVGTNRVERAQNVYNSLCAAGIKAQFALFPETGHELTSTIRHSATLFLRTDELADNFD